MGGAVSNLANQNTTQEMCGVTGIAAASNTQGPQEILKLIIGDPYLLKRFRKYVDREWTPDHAGDIFFQSEGASIALNFIDFACDVSDFQYMPQCCFQNFQSLSIFQTYVMHGASKRIFLTMNTADDITDKICQRTDIQDSNLFAIALEESIEFLIAEVLPSYRNKYPSFGIDAQRIQIADILHGATVCHRPSLFQSPDQSLINSIFDKVISDPDYYSAFQDMMFSRGASNIIHAFNNIQDMNQHFKGLLSSTDLNEEIRMMKFLEIVHSFYKMYLSTSSQRRVSLSTATFTDFIYLLSNCTRVDSNILRPIENNLKDIIEKVYVDLFLRSSQYRLIERSGRSSVSVLAGQLTVPMPQVSNDITDLKLFLRSQYDGVFAKFLAASNQLQYLHFYQSAFRYRETTYKFDIDRIVESGYVIDRYIARNSLNQISIPEIMREKLLRNRFHPTPDIFIEAENWVLHFFCQYCWAKFKTKFQFGPEEQINQCVLRSHSHESIASTYCVGHENRQEISLDTNEELNCPRVNKDFIQFGRHTEATCARILRLSASTTRYCLKDVIENPKTCGLFKEFLDKEGTSQTLLFVMEVDEYRKIPMADYMVTRCRKLYNKYIHNRCFSPVPVTDSTRNEIASALENPTQLTQSVFQSAVIEVYRYIENNQYVRFVLSPEYLLVADAFKLESSLEPGNRRVVRRSSIQLDPMPPGSIKNLRDILTHQTCTRFFKDFCVRSYASENLYFWLDAENYSTVPGSDFRRSTARKIYGKYIVETARMEINVSSEIREHIKQSIDSADRNLFKNAQEAVFNLMENDTLVKFLHSEEYANLRKYAEESVTNLSVVTKHANSHVADKKRPNYPSITTRRVHT